MRYRFARSYTEGTVSPPMNMDHYFGLVVKRIVVVVERLALVLVVVELELLRLMSLH